MNRINRITLSLIAFAAAATMTTACSDPNDDEPTVYTDIVSFTSQTDKGSSFTLRKEGDSPLVTLTSATRLRPQDFKTGTRIVLQYIPESGNQYESGPVRLYAAMNVQGSEVLEGTAASTDNWASHGMMIYSVNRTGEFLNIFGQGKYSTKPDFKLYIDSSTLDAEYPEVHMVFRDDNQLMSSNHIVYGSFDISSVWERPTCKGIHFYSSGINAGGYIPILKADNPDIEPSDPDVDITI